MRMRGGVGNISAIRARKYTQDATVNSRGAPVTSKSNPRGGSRIGTLNPRRMPLVRKGAPSSVVDGQEQIPMTEIS